MSYTDIYFLPFFTHLPSIYLFLLVPFCARMGECLYMSMWMNRCLRGGEGVDFILYALVLLAKCYLGLPYLHNVGLPYLHNASYG